VWATKRGRAALLVVLGAALGGCAVCLPFFVSAPSTMWRMVVLDQLERPEVNLSYVRRLNALTGLTPFRLVENAPALILFATGCVVLAAVLAWTVSRARSAVTLLVAMGIALMATPSFFTHYAAAIAVPMAVVIGAAVGVATTWLTHRRPTFAVAAALAGLVTLLGLALPYAIVTIDRPFPAEELSQSATTAGGCVTSDEPTTLIELNLISQNIARGCPFVVDLGGYAYDQTKLNGETLTSGELQRHELSYLTGGDLIILARSRSGFGFHPIDQDVTDRWSLIHKSGKVRVYRPS
jgi:alpha-1,2-mannosyltransferase